MTVLSQAAPAQKRAHLLLRAPEALLEFAARFWSSGFVSAKKANAVFWVLLVAICAGRAFIGLSGMRVYSHDGFLVLDGAWRMVNGQRPHVDFNSMVGPVAYLPTVLGFWLSGAGAAGFGYGQAIAGALLGAWAFVLSRRFDGVPRLAFALSVAAIAASPAMVGPSPFDLSPGMTYNRYTYALLGLVMLECVLERRTAEFGGGFSSGVALGLMTFLKMTGVVIETVLLVSLLPMRRQTGRRWVGFACGFFVTALPLLAYLRFQVGLVWRDLALTAAAKHMVIYDRYDFESIVLEAAFAGLVTVVAARWLTERGRELEARRILWSLAAVLAASVGLMLGNFQRASMPLVVLMLIVVIDTLAKQTDRRASANGGLRSVAFGGASIFVAAFGLSLVISLLSGVALRLFTVSHRPVFQAPALASFVPVNEDIGYTEWANDGFALLAAHRQPGEHVMSLDFTNPFAFGLHIPPAAGGTTNLQYRGSFDERHRLSAERLFGAAELVMLPLVYSDQSLNKSIPEIYGPYLHRHYALIGETNDWQLYRRMP